MVRRFKNVLDAYHFLKSQSRLKNSHYNDKTTMKKSRTHIKIQSNKIPQKRIGVNSQKILKWMKTFGDNMKQSFWNDYELRTKNESKKNDLWKGVLE